MTNQTLLKIPFDLAHWQKVAAEKYPNGLPEPYSDDPTQWRAELIKILEGEPPYDIFVRWKPLHKRPIGWEPDINDGVRLNIRPFMTARPLAAHAKGACILRVSPKIK